MLHKEQVKIDSLLTSPQFLFLHTRKNIILFRSLRVFPARSFYFLQIYHVFLKIRIAGQNKAGRERTGQICHFSRPSPKEQFSEQIFKLKQFYFI